MYFVGVFIRLFDTPQPVAVFLFPLHHSHFCVRYITAICRVLVSVTSQLVAMFVPRYVTACCHAYVSVTVQSVTFTSHPVAVFICSTLRHSKLLCLFHVTSQPVAVFVHRYVTASCRVCVSVNSQAVAVFLLPSRHSQLPCLCCRHVTASFRVSVAVTPQPVAVFVPRYVTASCRVSVSVTSQSGPVFVSVTPQPVAVFLLPVVSVALDS